MFGDNANMVLLDTYVKGLADFNVSVAYEAMRANALGPRPRDGRGGIEQYIQLGFVPLEASEKGTSDTLAYAYNDWALARLATILGRDEDVAVFFERALNYRNAFDPVELFMCPRWQVRMGNSLEHGGEAGTLGWGKDRDGHCNVRLLKLGKKVVQTPNAQGASGSNRRLLSLSCWCLARVIGRMARLHARSTSAFPTIPTMSKETPGKSTPSAAHGTPPASTDPAG